MSRSRLITARRLLRLCRDLGRGSGWSTHPSAHAIESCHREADDILDGFPSAAEEVAAILYVFSRNEYQLGDAAVDLPVAAAIAQARMSDVTVSAAQLTMLKDLQDDITEDLSWEDTIARCEQILRQARR